MLQSLLRAMDIDAPPIFVRLREAADRWPHGQADRGLDALTPFGDLDSVLAASEFLSNTPDAAARAFCEAYRASLPAEQRDDPANRSAFPWDRLDETYRQANRDAVAHIAAKLASAGIDPARWRGVAGVPQLATASGCSTADSDLELLARLEHERWNAQRRMDGWRSHRRAAKDEARRLHPSLVPYDELTDDVKEYDRVYRAPDPGRLRAARVGGRWADRGRPTSPRAACKAELAGPSGAQTDIRPAAARLAVVIGASLAAAGVRGDVRGVLERDFGRSARAACVAASRSGRLATWAGASALLAGASVAGGGAVTAWRCAGWSCGGGDDRSGDGGARAWPAL